MWKRKLERCRPAFNDLILPFALTKQAFTSDEAQALQREVVPSNVVYHLRTPNIHSASMRTPGTPSNHNKNALPIWFSFVKCDAQYRSHCNSHSTDAVLGSPIVVSLAPQRYQRVGCFVYRGRTPMGWFAEHGRILPRRGRFPIRGLTVNVLVLLSAAKVGKRVCRIVPMEEACVVVVVFGVAGSGKSRIGAALARSLRWTFYDADDFHGQKNLAKLQRGIPLTDRDRGPWLNRLRWIIKRCLAERHSMILACSALKRMYRQHLRIADNVIFVYLKITPALVERRLQRRKGHFMNEDLLESQFATLEEPTAGAIVMNASQKPRAIVNGLRNRLLAQGYRPGPKDIFSAGGPEGLTPYGWLVSEARDFTSVKNRIS